MQQGGSGPSTLGLSGAKTLLSSELGGAVTSSSFFAFLCTKVDVLAGAAVALHSPQATGLASVLRRPRRAVAVDCTPPVVLFVSTADSTTRGGAADPRTQAVGCTDEPSLPSARGR